MAEMGLFWKNRGARKKTVVHYVALNPIVWLLVASINRPLSGCLNQNDSNTSPVMMPPPPPLRGILNRETALRGGGGGERAETKEKRRRRKEHIMRNATKGAKKEKKTKSKGLGKGLADRSPPPHPPPHPDAPAVFTCAELFRGRSKSRVKTRRLRSQTSDPLRAGGGGGRRPR